MQTSNRIVDDIARVANGAGSSLAGVKGEIDALIRQKIDKFINDADLVSRDEFEAVKAMAAEARAEQERLGKRLSALEKQWKLLTQDKAHSSKQKTAAKDRASTRRKPPKARTRKTSLGLFIKIYGRAAHPANICPQNILVGANFALALNSSFVQAINSVLLKMNYYI